MNPTQVMTRSLLFLVMLLTAPGVLAQDGIKAVPLKPLVDQPIESYRLELLDLAMQAAEAMPVVPQIKNRARAQEDVVLVCLDLHQPKRALGYIERIENWRRGSGYADLALYCAQNGYTENVEFYLAAAMRHTEEPELADWRRNTIKLKVGRARNFLGQYEQAKAVVADIDDPERPGDLISADAVTQDQDPFDDRIAALDHRLEIKDFNLAQASLIEYTALYDLHYQNPLRRKLLKDKMREAWDILPAFMRVDTLMNLAEIALSKEDKLEATTVTDEAYKILTDFDWPDIFKAPKLAEVAAYRYRVGDTTRSSKMLEEALALYHSGKVHIQDFDRCQHIRPIAESMVTAGDLEGALEVYRVTVEEGAVNFNIRPRSEDLCKSAWSMALYGVEPDASLWARMRQILQVTLERQNR